MCKSTNTATYRSQVEVDKSENQKPHTRRTHSGLPARRLADGECGFNDVRLRQRNFHQATLKPLAQQNKQCAQPKPYTWTLWKIHKNLRLDSPVINSASPSVRVNIYLSSVDEWRTSPAPAYWMSAFRAETPSHDRQLLTPQAFALFCAAPFVVEQFAPS